MYLNWIYIYLCWDFILTYHYDSVLFWSVFSVDKIFLTLKKKQLLSIPLNFGWVTTGWLTSTYWLILGKLNRLTPTVQFTGLVWGNLETLGLNMSKIIGNLGCAEFKWRVEKVTLPLVVTTHPVYKVLEKCRQSQPFAGKTIACKM